MYWENCRLILSLLSCFIITRLSIDQIWRSNVISRLVLLNRQVQLLIEFKSFTWARGGIFIFRSQFLFPKAQICKSLLHYHYFYGIYSNECHSLVSLEIYGYDTSRYWVKLQTFPQQKLPRFGTEDFII